MNTKSSNVFASLLPPSLYLRMEEDIMTKVLSFEDNLKLVNPYVDRVFVNIPKTDERKLETELGERFRVGGLIGICVYVDDNIVTMLVTENIWLFDGDVNMAEMESLMRKLSDLLVACDVGVKDCYINPNDSEEVVIEYGDRYVDKVIGTKEVNIACDSKIAIVKDVVKQVLR